MSNSHVKIGNKIKVNLFLKGCQNEHFYKNNLNRLIQSILIHICQTSSPNYCLGMIHPILLVIVQIQSDRFVTCAALAHYFPNCNKSKTTLAKPCAFLGSDNNCII